MSAGGAIPRKAIIALLREKQNALFCETESAAYTTCLAASEFSQVKCMPHKRALDYCLLYQPKHDRQAFRMRRTSFLQDMLRTSRMLAGRFKH
eukprot:UN00175